MGAAAGRVLLLARHAEARAHDAALVVTAFADSNATQSGVREAAVVLREFEVRVRAPRIVVGAKTQIFIQPVRLDDHPGIHLPVRIPSILELVERLDQFRSEHLWKPFGARLPLAMFTRK